MKRASLTGLLFLSCLMGFTQQANAADMLGLIGIQYGDEDFEKPGDLVKLGSLGRSWGGDDGFGSQWAGKWQGMITGPANADITFAVETDQTARITVAGKTVVACKRGSARGRHYIS